MLVSVCMYVCGRQGGSSAAAAAVGNIFLNH